MNDRQLIADLLSALEYHTEQTRPIEFSKVAIEAAREYLRKPEHPAQQPMRSEAIYEICRRTLPKTVAGLSFVPEWALPLARAVEAAHGITGEKK